MMHRRRPDLSLKRLTTLLAALAAIGVACGRASTEPEAAHAVADAAATVAQVAAAVTGQDAPLADDQLDGKHLGFDTHTYPGDKTMHAWKTAANAPYSWVGYYLVSPCHKDASWSGKRTTLTGMGWGLAAVYVGQQTWGRTPKPLTPARITQLAKSRSNCNADFLTADRGVADGRDAIAKTTAEGFAPRSVVFLDIERMEKMPQAMRDYYRAWARTLLQDGHFLPGVYVHAHNAQAVHDDLKAEFLAAGVKEEPRVWVATGHGFDETKSPQDVGFTFAGMWQGMIDVARRVADIKLPVDVNVSSWVSPSEPATRAAD
ncbi:MAG TPA: glycoside hydrolase domain-containing protein [Gemmatimonadaceae bacterium]|nr:glycoside hydrolase domain-containing protein [Gemmatimonadaceae bacterium]